MRFSRPGRPGISAGILACIFIAAVSISGSGCRKMAEEVLQTLPGKEDNAEEGEGDGGGTAVKEAVTVRFRLPAKDAASWFEENIRTLQLLVYCNGVLVEEVRPEGHETEIQLFPGEEYSFYAIANTAAEAKLHEEEFRKTRVVSSRPDAAGSFPMAGCGSFTAGKGGSTVDLVLERLHAMIAFSMDKSGAPGLEVSSVRIMQQASSISLFEENCATDVSDGPAATAEQLAAVNSGDEAVFYIPENCQGVLLPDNTDSWAKVPDNIPGKAGLCTYIEVEGTFNGEDVLNGDVVYRFYLGEDVTSDFNIFRNSENHVSLVPTRDAMTRPSWKIDAGKVYADVPFLAVDSNGKIYYRRGDDVNILQPFPSILYKVLNTGRKYIAAGHLRSGASAFVASSTNGLIWNQCIIEGHEYIFDIAYGNGTYVAVCSGSGLAVSSDENNWSMTEEEKVFRKIDFGNGRFVAICTNGEIGTSADGLTWEYRQTGTDLNEVVAGDGEFLVHGDSGILKSEDGLDWTLHEETPSISGSTLEIRYGNGIYLAADGKWLYTSTDGITWEQNEDTFTKGKIDFRDGVFIMSYFSRSPTIFSTSIDGKTWTEIDRELSFDAGGSICIM